MRSFLALMATFLLTALAQATPGPVPDVKLSPSPAEYAIATEALGATLESDYFKAPQHTFVSGNTCRLYFDYLGKDRLAASCR